MGRAAALGVFGSPGREDYRAAEEALERVDAAAYAQPFRSAFGGRAPTRHAGTRLGDRIGIAGSGRAGLGA